MHSKFSIHFLFLCALTLLPGMSRSSESDHMMGCYALDKNAGSEIRFEKQAGKIRWSVLRHSGWRMQDDVVHYYDAVTPHPDIPPETFEKMAAMLDMGDGYFLIKFKPDRLKHVKANHPNASRALAKMKKLRSNYLISVNGLGPTFPVACDNQSPK